MRTVYLKSPFFVLMLLLTSLYSQSIGQENSQGSRLVTVIFGENISERIDRLSRHPEFPWASAITIPEESFFEENLSVIPQKSLYSMLNSAYVAYDKGSQMSGVYEDNAASIKISWRMNVLSISEEVPVENAEPIEMSQEYDFYISGQIGEEKFDEYQFMKYTSQQPNHNAIWFTRADFFKPDGQKLASFKRLINPVESVVGSYLPYRNGIEADSVYTGLE